MEIWFAKNLIQWYEQNKRDLPWRRVKDPYKIWLSEIILQQTQVAQGLSYYLKFIKTFPNVKSLAKAPEDEVLRLWQGLGYYSRARNLHFASKSIVKDLKGKFPASYKEIKELKGVGDYTAAAIASFAYDLPYAVLDGNVYRVLSRVFGISTPIDTTSAKKEFQELATHLLYKKDPATFNQAIMEFGSQYCKPANPNCEECVLSMKCMAFKHKLVAELPKKSKKLKIRNRYFNYLVVKDQNGRIRIHRRNGKDIWQGLYEFTLIESESEWPQEVFMKSKEFKKAVKGKFDIQFVSKQYKHVLSHQHLYAKFYVILLDKKRNKPRTKKNEQNSSMLIESGKLENFAFSRLSMKFMEDCLLKEII